MAATTTRLHGDDSYGGDAALVARVARGDAGALEQVMALYQARVARLAQRLLAWNGDVQDVVQDVFVTALEKARGFRGDASLWTWLTVITLNRCRTQQRRARIWRRVAGFVLHRRETEAAAADAGPMADETTLEVRAAVAALPRKDREVIVLFYLEQRSAAEIGGVVGASANAVEVRLHRARAKLREALRGFMDES